MSHQKHPPLTRPAVGRYAPVEFSVVGTTCVRMEALMDFWQQELAARAVLLVTGDHGTARKEPFFQHGSKQFSGGAQTWNTYDDRLLGRQYSLALVNGNHYPAARQIVFIDPDKAGTLKRRREQLTDVAAVVFCPGATELPAWLKDHLGDGAQVQCKLAEAGEVLLPLLKAAVDKAIPPLKALVLAGGQSSRMGSDKSQLKYHPTLTEAERMVQLCQQAGLKTFLSVATPDRVPVTSADGFFSDRFLGLGPLGAISTALLNDPNAAWLVLPCDLPLFTEGTLQQLIEARHTGKVATALKVADKPFPEPLATIYEPRAYPRLLQFLSLGYACPRKMLINSDVAIVDIEDATPLTNANTSEEREQVMRLLERK